MDSNHHPAQKIGILNTLATRSKRISDATHLDQELEHLTKVFINNGYNTKQINKTICNSQIIKPNTQKKEDVTKTIKLPYIKGTTDKIANILRKKKIRVAFSPLTLSDAFSTTLKIRLTLKETKEYTPSPLHLWESLYW